MSPQPASDSQRAMPNAVPSWHEFMAPALRALADGQQHQAREIREAVAVELGLTDDARSQLIPSGERRWENRVNWALSYLGRYGAAERPARGSYRIVDAGRALIEAHPGGITERDLRSTFGALPTSPTSTTPTVLDDAEDDLDPVEQIATGIARIHADVAAKLLTRLHGNDPGFFEQAVLDLLMAMGYGGAEGRATRTQLTNDGGVDGVIDEDALGLSRIYVQAKRYALDKAVARPELQAFVGALHGQQANRGVFITTARFSSGAAGYAESVPTRVVLIDGQRLADLMIQFGVGVQVKRAVKIVEIDEDFFE